MGERFEGEVKWFSPVKGYGFIIHNDEDVFVHYSALAMEGFKTLNKGDIVEFELKESEKGMQCIDVVVLEG